MDDIEKVKDRIEAEPRMILETWSEYKSGTNYEVKKDKKAAKIVGR